MFLLNNNKMYLFHNKELYIFAKFFLLISRSSMHYT